MKRKSILGFMLAVCFALPLMWMLASCKENDELEGRIKCAI